MTISGWKKNKSTTRARGPRSSDFNSVNYIKEVEKEKVTSKISINRVIKKSNVLWEADIKLSSKADCLIVETCNELCS